MPNNMILKQLFPNDIINIILQYTDNNIIILLQNDFPHSLKYINPLRGSLCEASKLAYICGIFFLSKLAWLLPASKRVFIK